MLTSQTFPQNILALFVNHTLSLNAPHESHGKKKEKLHLNLVSEKRYNSIFHLIVRHLASITLDYSCYALGHTCKMYYD